MAGFKPANSSFAFECLSPQREGLETAAGNLIILLVIVVYVSFFILKGNLHFDIAASSSSVGNVFTQYKKSALMLLAALAESPLFLFVSRLQIGKRKVFSFDDVILLLSGMYVAYAHLAIFRFRIGLLYDGIPGHQVTLTVFFSTSAVLILLSPRIRGAVLRNWVLVPPNRLCTAHRWLPAIVVICFLYVFGQVWPGSSDRYGFPAVLDSLGRFEYLAKADEFRKNCAPGSAFGLERNYWSLVVLCRPFTFQPGTHEATVAANQISYWRDAVWHREAVKERTLGSTPIIFVGETLFLPKTNRADLTREKWNRAQI